MALARWRRAGLSAVNSFSGGVIFVVGLLFVQALRLVALSLALSHGREDGVAVGVKVCYKENRLCVLFFTFQTTFINAQFSRLAPYNFQKSNQNQSSATVQAAFPILVTRAGFPPVRRLSAAKSRDSKNAAR